MIKYTLLTSFIFFITCYHVSKVSNEEIQNKFTMFVDLTVYDKNLINDVSCKRYDHDNFYSMYIIDNFNVSITLSDCGDAGFTEGYYTNVRNNTMELGYFTPIIMKYKGLNFDSRCIVRIIITCDGDDNNLVMTPQRFKPKKQKHADHIEKLILYGKCIDGIKADVTYDYGSVRDTSSIIYGTISDISGLLPNTCPK
ncbi:viral TNFR II-like protein [Deerpox virus W-848-83]|uniref:Viral TNFR II-like protein n=1 Tax=Deerpox virus (strain Mule deer/United States/W-848-83/1983) TaxID=305674 RepID=Q08FY4_DPV83|nr:Viral TNFR II-like c-terminal fragment [Deerpox virus W-848-83]ABI99173.1 viral TNFR II-like protein [Deerpox virus W-848-83]